MLRYILVLWIVLLEVACTSQDAKVVGPYINTKQFFESEIQRLTIRKIGIEKQLSFDGKQQSINTNAINWKKELDAFLAIDLQKNSYKNRFDIDTLVENDTLYQVRYTANDPKLDLRSCIFWMYKSSQKIKGMEAIFNDRNSLYQSGKTLYYDINSGYSITGKQAVKLGNEIDYEILASFQMP